MIDSGLSISLIQESIVVAYAKQIETVPKNLQLVSAEGKGLLS